MGGAACGGAGRALVAGRPVLKSGPWAAPSNGPNSPRTMMRQTRRRPPAAARDRFRSISIPVAEAGRRAVRVALRLGVVMLASGTQTREVETTLRVVLQALGVPEGQAVVWRVPLKAVAPVRIRSGLPLLRIRTCSC
jgi:hypothetical protein